MIVTTKDIMGLQEITLGGIYISPLLVYALAGFILTLLIRTLLHVVLSSKALWFEAWFDVSLFVILTALIAFVFTVLPGTY
ncbi:MULTISPECIES: DUF1656 domain-containing protein [unclassified Halomonas]|uniref:DUF1656 domain-containing protein n=1 Tax=unclassified Halomonas TaxID=2609666 RepID=UPI0021E49DF7|nr:MULTISPECIES: DUF1656 domain-containing protein [unclassified Halomonas]UYG00703.1 DUF1656 domain-containing protein [Halomonas sp. GD1P12]WNL38241.1 DUF1656 domain-containing protein [Halomonas sp. PAMB 3232]